MCFIDLQKAYDSVHNAFLWEVLAQFGVPPHMMMKSSVCLMVARELGYNRWQGTGVVSRVPGTKGKGVFRPPSLFYMFGTAFVDMILQRFTVDQATVSGLVYHDAPRGHDEPLAKTPLEKVRRAVWEIFTCG